MNSFADHVRDKRIIVCCGAGGVGKTTAAATLALAAARMGRRVLVLTIDPSKRLAETLGVARNQPEPLPLPEERQRAAGIEAPGSLSAWMLDPRLVSDRVVYKLARTREDAERLMSNRVYENVTRMVAGMHEYAAMEALYGFVREERYDLIVLDTPPSRNALNFLEAPTRLGAFLDGRIFKLFLPSKEGMLRSRATQVIAKVLGGIFGNDTFTEFQVFLSAFAGIFSVLNGNAKEMRAGLRRPEVTFLLVTSAAADAVDDAFFFLERMDELKLRFGGFVLNRSHAARRGRRWPDAELLPAEPSAIERSALEKLAILARREETRMLGDLQVLARIQERSDAPVLVTPEIPGGVHDMASLGQLTTWLTDEASDAEPVREQPNAASA